MSGCVSTENNNNQTLLCWADAVHKLSDQTTQSLNNFILQTLCRVKDKPVQTMNKSL